MITLEDIKDLGNGVYSFDYKAKDKTVKTVKFSKETLCYINTLARCIIKDKQVDNKEVAICYIPVYFLLNKFGNSAINSWDGNSIDLGEKTCGIGVGNFF